MKKLALFIFSIFAVAATNASIVEWDTWNPAETTDFEIDGLIYGIISEKRAEVQITSRNKYIPGPLPYGYVIDPFCTPYRHWLIFENELTYDWPGGYYEGNIEIPQEVVYQGKSYTVVRIAFGTFAWCDKLTSIKLPPTIREIRYGAFSMCTSLKEINLPPGTKICGGAFYGCSSLTSLDLSECKIQYHSQYDRAVCRCTGLQEVYLPTTAPFKEQYIEILETLDSQDSDWLGIYYTEYDDFPYIIVNDRYSTQHAVATARTQPHMRTSRMTQEEYEKLMEDAPVHTEFFGCDNLRKLHMTAPIPYDGSFMLFDSSDWKFLYENCQLYVPKGSLEAYRSTEPWSNFKSIVEEEGTSAIDEIQDAPSPDANASRQIFDLSGCLRLTLAPGETPTNLTPGLYIERTGSTSRKFVVH